MAAGPRTILRRLHEQLSQVRGVAGSLLFEARAALDADRIDVTHYEAIEDSLALMKNAVSRAQATCACYGLYPSGTYEEIIEASRASQAAERATY